MTEADGQADSVGARIRAARQARGWRQSDLAAAVRVSRSAVAQWETDRAGQGRDHLGGVAEVLGVSVEMLLYGEAGRVVPEAMTGDELALLRLYRACQSDDQAMLLRMARKLAQPAS